MIRAASTGYSVEGRESQHLVHILSVTLNATGTVMPRMTASRDTIRNGVEPMVPIVSPVAAPVVATRKSVEKGSQSA